MCTITTTDGTQIYYKDWGTGQPVIFSHGWPLTSDSWESQMVYLKAFSETDFTQDLVKFDVPTLILHGDDDQVVPIGASALRSHKIVKNAKLVVYPGAPHGLTETHKLADGSMLKADGQLAGTPSVLFDAIVVILSEAGANMLSKESSAIDFVRDAFAHLKAIGVDRGGQSFLKDAGVVSDAGIIGVSEMEAFLAAAKTRQWEWKLSLYPDAEAAVRRRKPPKGCISRQRSQQTVRTIAIKATQAQKPAVEIIVEQEIADDSLGQTARLEVAGLFDAAPAQTKPARYDEPADA